MENRVGIVGVVVICLLAEGSVDEVAGGKASFHHFLSFSHILLIPLGGVPGQGSVDCIFALSRMTVMILKAINDMWQDVAVSVLVAVASIICTGSSCVPGVVEGDDHNQECRKVDRTCCNRSDGMLGQHEW